MISILLVGGAVWLQRTLAARMDAWSAALAALGAFVVGVTVVFLVLPVVDEVPADFPAELLWRFRVGALATQIALWGAMGLAFGALVERRR